MGGRHREILEWLLVLLGLPFARLPGNADRDERLQREAERIRRERKEKEEEEEKKEEEQKKKQQS